MPILAKVEGLEPTTTGFGDHYAIITLRAYYAGSTGLEPMTL